eukprot:SAG11_NODE_20691_length_440_cov_0.847507_1_plen_125_part_10
MRGNSKYSPVRFLINVHPLALQQSGTRPQTTEQNLCSRSKVLGPELALGGSMQLEAAARFIFSTATPAAGLGGGGSGGEPMASNLQFSLVTRWCVPTLLRSELCFLLCDLCGKATTLTRCSAVRV